MARLVQPAGPAGQTTIESTAEGSFGFAEGGSLDAEPSDMHVTKRRHSAFAGSSPLNGKPRAAMH